MMHMMNFGIVPHWFSGYNIFLELLFSVASLFVGYFALKVYKLSGQRQSRLFGISFLMISAAYLIQSMLNFYGINVMAEGAMKTMMLAHNIMTIGVYVHIILFFTAYALLATVALRMFVPILYALFLGMVFTILAFSQNVLYMFYVISSILLVYISFYYLKNYLNTKKKSAFIVFIAFLFLLFGKIHFIFSVNHGAFYVAAHVLEFIAYILLLLNLLSIIHKK